MSPAPPQEENKCPGAEENGVSILHGNALAFVKVSFSFITFALADSFFEIQCMVDKIRERAQLSVWNYQAAAKTEDSFSSG